MNKYRVGLIIFFVSCFTTMAMAGKNLSDPTAPPGFSQKIPLAPAKLATNRLQLQMIYWSPTLQWALINNHQLQLGDTFGKYIVVTLGRDSVVLRDQVLKQEVTLVLSPTIKKHF